jgi:hypothetical protein
MGFVASFNLLKPCLAYLILDMRGVMAKNEVDDPYIYIYRERERERKVIIFLGIKLRSWY